MKVPGFIRVLIPACMAISCGPSQTPAYIAEVAGLVSSPAAAGAAELDPGTWAEAESKLAAARKAHARGDKVEAQALAFEASILVKKAMAIARQQSARGRIEDAQERIDAAGQALVKVQSQRVDSQIRYLDLMAFHDSQQDEAEIMLASFVKDKAAVAKLNEKDRLAWIDKEQARLDRDLQAVRATLLAATVLGCEGLVLSGTLEARAAAGRAEQAGGAAWDLRRPIVEDAKLRAERLLHDTRVMHEPVPLANPASETGLLDRLVEAMAGTSVVVSATRRGIVFSLRNPVDANGALTAGTKEALRGVVKALGGLESTSILVEVYSSGGCSGPGCGAESLTVATAVAGFAEELGVPASALTPAGWGVSPVFEPGHCLVQECAGGRLDLVVIAR